MYSLNGYEKSYTVLCTLFSLLVVLSNLVYQKFVTINFLSWYHLEISAGALIYPFSFLTIALITEFFGKEQARFCVRAGIVMNIIVVCLLAVVDSLPAAAWSTMDTHTFHQVFSVYGFAFTASLIACYCSQLIDIRVYLWLRKLTNGNSLWLRSYLSTAFSLALDTTIVVTCLSLFGVIPEAQSMLLLLDSYAFKLFFMVCSTPLLYASVYSMKRFA